MGAPDHPAAGRAGYLELIRGNRSLRRIWLADVASLFGDWFNMVALYTLVEELTGSPLALGGVFIVKLLSFSLAAPFAGLIADRLNRRRLMIACDLARAFLVLGFLLIDDRQDVPLLYALAAAQMMLGAAFIPARSASIPNVTSPRELLTANALMAATWSTLLAMGAAAGGFAADLLGLPAVFVIDSLSYCLSAGLLVGTVIPQRTEKPSGPLVRTAASGIVQGWRYVLGHSHVARALLVKPAWTVAGSSLVYMLALLGTDMMPAAPSIGIGLLYAARGLGTGIGPIAARAAAPKRRAWPLMFGLGICASAVFYFSVGGVVSTSWVLLFVVLAHVPSGINWTFSTVLLQERTPDPVRGRVFATEWLLLTLLDAAGILIASLLLERGALSLRSAIQVFAGVQLACGVLWIALAVPRERAWQRSRPASAT